QAGPGGVHEVDVLGEGPEQRAGDSLPAPVLDQTAPDLVMDRLPELLDPLGDLLVHQPTVELAQLSFPSAQDFAQEPLDLVDVEPAEDALEVLGAPDGASPLEPR